MYRNVIGSILAVALSAAGQTSFTKTGQTYTAAPPIGSVKIVGNASASKFFSLGYDETTDVGYIQAYHTGTGVIPMWINPAGGETDFGGNIIGPQLSITRSGVTRATILGGGPGGGGIISTYDSTGGTLVNRLNDSGIDAVSGVYKVGGTTIIDASRNASFNSLTTDSGTIHVDRSAVTRISLSTGGVGGGGILSTFDSTGATVINRLDQNGVGTTSIGNYSAGVYWALPSADSVGCFQSNGSGTMSISACGGSLAPYATIDNTGLYPQAAYAATLPLGKTTVPWVNIYGTNVYGEAQKIAVPGTSFGTSWTIQAPVSSQFQILNSSGSAVFQFDTSGSPTLANFVAHVTPTASGTYDLGTSSLKWRDAYLSNSIVMNGTTFVNTTRDVTANSLTTDSGSIHVDRSAVTRISLSTGGAGAGGIIQTFNSAGSTTTNRLDDTGLGIGVVPTQTLHVSKSGQVRAWIESSTAGQPDFVLSYGDGGANEKYWSETASSGTLSFRAVNDAYSSASNWLTVTRTGTTIGTVSFPNGDVSISGNLNVSGTCTGCGVSSINSAIGALTLAGTANRVTVSTVGTTITISAPQDIATTSNVQFGSLNIGGTSAIDGVKNASLTSLSIGGTSTIDSSRNGAFNSLTVDSGTLHIDRSGTTKVSMSNGGALGGGIVQTFDSTGLTVQNSLNQTDGVRSNIGFNANGSAGVSATKTPNGTCTLIFTFGILTGGTC